MTSFTDFITRSDLLQDFCDEDQKRSERIEEARLLSGKLQQEIERAIHQVSSYYYDDDDIDDEETADDHEMNGRTQEEQEDSSSLLNNMTPKRLSSNADTLKFDSPSEENGHHPLPPQQQQQQSSSKTTTKEERIKQKREDRLQMLSEQQKALQHELTTLKKQQYLKKTGIQQKASEIAQLRNLTENVLPRAIKLHQKRSSLTSSFGVSKVLNDCQAAAEASLEAAQRREMELRNRLYQQQQQNFGSKENQAPPNHSSSSSTRKQILEKTVSKLEQEKKKKLDLISTFEKKIEEQESSRSAEFQIKKGIESMRLEMIALRDKEKFLRQALAADAVRRVLDAKNQPLKLRGRSAHARLQEAMAFLKAEVVHFGHDVRPVSKALSAADPENLFKKAHNELKLIVGLMLPSGENAHAQFQRRQGQTWPLTYELLVDRFPQHKIDVAYVKLQEMVVAWDCLSRASQERLTTAQDVVNNAEVLLMFARHVGELYQDKKNQLTERATHIASLSTGDHQSSSENTSNSISASTRASMSNNTSTFVTSPSNRRSSVPSTAAQNSFFVTSPSAAASSSATTPQRQATGRTATATATKAQQQQGNRSVMMTSPIGQKREKKMTSTPPPSSTLSKYPLSGTTDQSSGRYLPAAVTAFGNKSTTVGKSPIASSLATGAQHSQAANNTSSRIPADRSFTSLLTATNNESVSRRPTAAQQDSNNNTTQHQYQTTHIDPNTRSFRSSLATANQSATITSAAARAEALENELDRVKKRNQQLETDMVEMRREQHNHRLEREQERVAASQRHYQEIEIERDRVKQAREDDEHRHQEAIQAERRRTEEISSRCRNLEDQVSRLNLVIGDKDQQLELANKKSSDLEVKISDVMREMQTVVRTYEAKLSTMNQVLESRADEIDAAHAATKEAENVSDSLRRQIRDLEEKKADLQADNGKLEVAVQSAKQDFRIVQQELNEERDRRNREQNAIVSAAEKQRDEMRHQDDIIAELREELRKKAKEIHDLDLELNKTRSNNAELNSEIERVGREAQRWEKRAEDNGSEYHVQVLKCQDFEAAFERTKSDLREAEVRGVEASELITRLREHISELKDELTKAQALAESYKSQLSAVNFAHQQLRSQSAMIERCEHDLEAREKKIRELAQELHVAEEKGSMAQELVGHVKQLETELQSKAEYADTILGRLDSVKGALETARQDIIEKEAAIERLNLRIHEFEGALRERDDRVYVLEREVATKNLLEQNCAELEQNLSNRTRELEKSFEEIGLLKHRIMDLEQHQAEAQDYQVTIKRLDTERVVMHNEMESLKATINDRENEIRSLRMDVEERATDVEGKNVELNKMKRDLEAARRIEAERAALKDRVHTLENNIDETMNQLRNVQQQNESLHQDCSTTQQQLSQSRIATNEAREKLENTKRALDELQVENGRLHVLNDNFKRDYDKANIEKQNAQNKVQQYGNQIDQLRGQLNDLTAKESSVTHLAETTQAELRQKSIQVEDLSKQLQELRRQVAHREQTIGNLEEDNSQLRATSAKISVMEGKVSALERLVHDKEMEIDRISLLNRQQQDQLSSMSTELQQAERQVRAAQDVRRKASSLQDDLDEANDENATLKQQVSEKERVISQLHNQIKDMGSDIDGYKKRERNSESTIEQLEGEVRRLKICEGESQGLVTVLRSKDADIDNLRDQTRQQSQRIGELEEQLQRNQRVVHENAVLEARMKSRDETVTALEKEMNNRAQENRELTAEVEHLTQSMRKLQSTADSLKESRDIGERENKGLRDRIEFLMKGAKEDTIHAATEIETFKNVANESKAELAQQRERAHALQLQVARQQDQLSAAEKRYDVVAKELAAQKAEFNSMKLAFEERGNTINRLQENLSLEQRRAQGASDVVATLQSSANENALRTADERTEATKHIDRLERVVDDLKSQLNQRNTTLTERGRTLAMQEERLRDVEAELRRANEQKAVLQHRVTSLEDDIKVLQRTNDMATARRKAAELSLQEADEKLSEKELKYRELDRMSSFERMTHSDRENALRREADRLAATESQLRRRTHELESQLDEVRSSPGRSFAGQNNDFGSGSRSRTRY